MHLGIANCVLACAAKKWWRYPTSGGRNFLLHRQYWACWVTCAICARPALYFAHAVNTAAPRLADINSVLVTVEPEASNNRSLFAWCIARSSVFNEAGAPVMKLRARVCVCVYVWCYTFCKCKSDELNIGNNGGGGTTSAVRPAGGRQKLDPFTPQFARRPYRHNHKCLPNFKERGEHNGAHVRFN